MNFGKEAQHPIDLIVPKLPGDPRLKLVGNAGDLKERLYELHIEAQTTIATEQRRQRENLNRKYMAIRLKKRPSLVVCTSQGKV